MSWSFPNADPWQCSERLLQHPLCCYVPGCKSWGRLAHLDDHYHILLPVMDLTGTLLEKVPVQHKMKCTIDSTHKFMQYPLKNLSAGKELRNHLKMHKCSLFLSLPFLLFLILFCDKNRDISFHVDNKVQSWSKVTERQKNKNKIK